MQLFLVFFGINIFGLPINPWIAASLALTLHASAFLGEIWRGCIEAVPRGQREAATALGLSYYHRMTLRDPAAGRADRASPPTVGFLVQLIKGTSLASIIGFTELTRAGQIINNATFQPFQVFGTVAALYFVLCWPLSLLARRMETPLLAALHAPADTNPDQPRKPRHEPSTRRTALGPDGRRRLRRAPARRPRLADEIKAKGEITVGMLVDFPPFGIMNARTSPTATTPTWPSCWPRSSGVQGQHRAGHRPEPHPLPADQPGRRAGRLARHHRRSAPSRSHFSDPYAGIAIVVYGAHRRRPSRAPREALRPHASAWPAPAPRTPR